MCHEDEGSHSDVLSEMVRRQTQWYVDDLPSSTTPVAAAAATSQQQSTHRRGKRLLY